MRAKLTPVHPNFLPNVNNTATPTLRRLRLSRKNQRGTNRRKLAYPLAPCWDKRLILLLFDDPNSWASIPA
jgi:hypothetical protein